MKTKILTVDTTIGKKRLDSTGAPIGVSRIDPAQAYGPVPLLLQEYINAGSTRAWQEIMQRTDNVYQAIGVALAALDREASFSAEIVTLLATGRKLLFKPNHVMLPSLDPKTHGPVLIGVNTTWEFLAALMRWFHDKYNVSYHQMVVGEAGTTTYRLAKAASQETGQPVTTEAIMEGKYGDSYGGWGFYFARKYLAERHDRLHTDNPMSGYTDSLKETCLPPGKAAGKLMLYDLNKIAADGSNSREVTAAHGVNFKRITLHKAIIGGDPADATDTRDWPGCVLVNVARLKIHNAQLFTAAIKNIGIGLYPLAANASRDPDKIQWKYAIPHLKLPSVKMGLPHHRWLVETDTETGLPVRDKKGGYVHIRTGGLEADMADVLEAVKDQYVKMVHVVDAIETANIAHISPMCRPVPEGFVFAGMDPVALDVCTARYLFTMVPLAEVDEVRKQHGFANDVIQKTPLPVLAGGNIATSVGYDTMFTRYNLFRYCQKRGLGRQRFYVVGADLREGGQLASLRQRLGRVQDGKFTELLTSTMYHTPNKPLWDLQAASMAYLELNDKLTGSEFRTKIIEAYDENRDGVIDYMETGRGNSPYVNNLAHAAALQDINPLLALKFIFLVAVTQLKLLNRDWNRDGHDVGAANLMVMGINRALAMSRFPEVKVDPLFPGRTWGKGNWPSLQYAMWQQVFNQTYGPAAPGRFDLVMAPYGLAFRYADAKYNGGNYQKNVGQGGDPIGSYHGAVASGSSRLPFVFYVPSGFATASGNQIPNVTETADPALVFTAQFGDGEVWQELRVSEYGLK